MEPLKPFLNNFIAACLKIFGDLASVTEVEKLQMLPEKICAFHFRIFTGMLLLRVSSFMCAEFFYLVKGTLSSLRQCLATESSLKIIKSAFYFTLKALLILNIFKFLS